MARLGVGAGVDGAAGDLTELVELVRLRIERSILKAFTACSSENSKYLYVSQIHRISKSPAGQTDQSTPAILVYPHNLFSTSDCG